MSKVKPVKIQCPGVATQVSKLLKENPSEVIGAILNEAFWIPELKTSLTYSRLGDDDDGVVSIAFGKDSDAHIQILSETDTKPASGGFSISHRFRCYFGGGESLRTRTALMILARAMELDHKEKPQEGRRLRLKNKKEGTS
ncbi:MAG: hypothetical protein AAB597_03365 [Patescibacteria group bacterium]